MPILFHHHYLRLRFVFALLALVLSSFAPAFPQQVGYRLYTVDDGLVQSEITALYQDQKGFLWVGTKCGISRFDGHTFRTIRDTAGISDGWVFYIRELNDTTLWFLTAKGCVLVTYAKKSLNVQSFPVDGHFIGYWVQDGKGHFFNQYKEYFQVDHTGVKKIENGLFNKIGAVIRENSWVDLTHSKQDGNLYFRSKDGELICLRDSSIVKLKVKSFTRLITGHDGKIYLLTPDYTLNRCLAGGKVVEWKNFPGNVREPVKLHLLTDTTFSLVADFGNDPTLLENQLMILNRDTIIFSSPDEPLMQIYANGVMKRYRTPFPAIHVTFVDRENNLWGASPMGLIRLHATAFTEYDEKDGLYNNLQLVAEDKNHCIITGSFEEGLQKISNDRITRLPIPDFSHAGVLRQVYPGSGKDRHGNLYLSVNPYAMLIWDGQKLTNIPEIPITSAYSYFDDTVAGRQYMGANIGLIQWNDGMHVYHETPGGKGNKVVSMAKDGQGRLLLGGFKGLSYLKDDKITHLPTPEFPYTQGANAMAKDHRGNIWIGNSTGLWMFDSKTFRKIDNPWFNSMVVSLCTVDTSKLFIGGLYGIGFLDLEAFYRNDTAIIRYFNSDNGFTGKECQQNAVCLDHNGYLWVATTDNLQRIDPEHLPPVGAGPMTYIEQISLIDESMKLIPLRSSSASSGRIDLNHHDRNLRFDFTAPVFRGPSFVRFRYMLEGHDKQWSPPTVERYAVYTNLDPGHYTFRVMACNDAGIWSHEPASCTVVIAPAFWQRWWFWALAVTLLAGFFFLLGFMVMNRRRIRLQEKLEYEKQIAELQLVSIRNQIDPHFTFNAINSIASVILHEEKEKAYGFFVKLSAMIRQVLASSDQVTRPLAEELEFVQNYLEIEKLRFPESFQFTINLPENLELTREVPKMVIQTYAENAIKHGLLNKKEGEGKLEITLTQTDKHLTIIIEDNGIGRANAHALGQKSTGKGMAILNFYYAFFERYNTQKILHEITDLHDQHNQPTGTRVTIRIPVGFRYRTKELGIRN